MLNLSNFHDIQTLIVTTSYVNVISRCVFFLSQVTSFCFIISSLNVAKLIEFLGPLGV